MRLLARELAARSLPSILSLFLSRHRHDALWKLKRIVCVGCSRGGVRERERVKRRLRRESARRAPRESRADYVSSRKRIRIDASCERAPAVLFPRAISRARARSQLFFCLVDCELVFGVFISNGCEREGAVAGLNLPQTESRLEIFCWINNNLNEAEKLFYSYFKKLLL